MAGSSQLSEHWGSYQMLFNISKHKGQLDAMLGYKDTVDEHLTGEVLNFMEYQNDIAAYQNRLSEVNKK